MEIIKYIVIAAKLVLATLIAVALSNQDTLKGWNEKLSLSNRSEQLLSDSLKLDSKYFLQFAIEHRLVCLPSFRFPSC